MSTERNIRVQARYDELMREGKHGHYETLFRIVAEEVKLAEDEAGAARRRLAYERGQAAYAKTKRRWERWEP